ncbi:MAG: tyrosine-type recombinase/integrase [Phycisphaeraceae bacterium]
MAKKTKPRTRSKGSGSLFKRSGKGPWIATWYDHDGRRREKSTRTTDKAAAERILAKHVADAALRRDGVIDVKRDRFAVEGRKPLSEHIEAYITHCRHRGLADHHINQKQRHLDRMVKAARVTRLADLTSDALERHLRQLKDSGLSARSVNFARQIAVAFYSWCVKTGRAEVNPLSVVPKLDETRDRRRVRRPLTDDELARLLAVAREHGREAWYLAAAMAGLRRGDLLRLKWSDVDFEASTITIREGKARRVDVIPMHPQLTESLRRHQQQNPAVGATKVFSAAVGSPTVLNDFYRAGIARKEPVRDTDGNIVQIGKGTRRSPKRTKMRIVTIDEDGREIDLHALRTTLGTQLARAGVAPQIAQRIMRHGDYRTTLKHYTVLGLTDTARAIESLDAIRESSSMHSASGTDGEGLDEPAIPDPQLYPQQLARVTGHIHASPRTNSKPTPSTPRSTNPVKKGPYRPLDGKRAKGLEPSTFSLEGCWGKLQPLERSRGYGWG